MRAEHVALQLVAAEAVHDRADHLPSCRPRSGPAVLLATRRARHDGVGRSFAAAASPSASRGREVGLGQLLVERGVVAFPAIVRLRLELRRQRSRRRTRRSPRTARALPRRGRSRSAPRRRRAAPRARPRRAAARPPRAGAAGIAEHQRPGLGAQVVEVDVVFGGEAVAAEGVQRLGARAAARRAFHQAASETARRRRASPSAMSRIVFHRKYLPPSMSVDEVGERMRDRLERADQLRRTLALAGIGGGQPHAPRGRGPRARRRSAASIPRSPPRKRRALRRRARAPSLAPRRDRPRRSASRRGSARGGDRSRGSRAARPRRRGGRSPLRRPPRRRPIEPRARSTSWKARVTTASPAIISRGDPHRRRACEQPRRDERLGDRSRGQRAAGLLHEHRRVERAEAEPAAASGTRIANAPSSARSPPQGAIETARQRRAHARRAAPLVEEARERFAHALLLFAELQIHRGGLVRTALDSK